MINSPLSLLSLLSLLSPEPDAGVGVSRSPNVERARGYSHSPKQAPSCSLGGSLFHEGVFAPPGDRSVRGGGGDGRGGAGGERWKPSGSSVPKEWLYGDEG